jgi:hypothetical protein
MKKIIAALVLILASMSSFAATEIWMMHDPSCPFCREFLNDHGIENGPNHVPQSEFLTHEPNTIVLEIFNLQEDLPTEVKDALEANQLSIPYTPFFIRWDTETKTITGVWRRGWNIRMMDDFHHWITDDRNSDDI